MEARPALICRVLALSCALPLEVVIVSGTIGEDVAVEALLASSPELSARLARIRKLGFRLAVDDIGAPASRMARGWFDPQRHHGGAGWIRADLGGASEYMRG